MAPGRIKTNKKTCKNLLTSSIKYDTIYLQNAKGVSIMKYKVVAKKFIDRTVCEENLVFKSEDELQSFCANNIEYREWIYYRKNTLSFTRSDLEFTPKNVAKLRNEYNCNNPAYAVCVLCGKQLHEHNKDDHILTKYGYVGAECFKKVLHIL